MKCPVCKGNSLEKHELEAGLPAHRCTVCQGVWLSAGEYWPWRRALGKKELAAELEPPVTVTPIEDVSQVKQCPECEHILRRYQVWPNVQFYLDRCSQCGSVWFDRDEWSYVKKQGVHSHVHLVFTDTWQERIRAEEMRQHMDLIYLERFGAQDYQQIQEIRQWLWEHPKRAALLAFLTDRDPYQAVSGSGS